MRKVICFFVVFTTVLYSCKKSADDNGTSGDKPEPSLDTIAAMQVHPIQLAAANVYADNQYSGMTINAGYLYLMSESRAGWPAFVDRALLAEVRKAVSGPSYIPAFERLTIKGLEIIQRKLSSRAQYYEGLESMCMDGSNCYFTVETTSASDSGYVIKGSITSSGIDIDTSVLRSIPKPKTSAGRYIGNAGFESLVRSGDMLYAFYEYNNFAENGNLVAMMSTGLDKVSLSYSRITRTPYRLTDVCGSEGTSQLIGMNYFYKGDTEYQPKAGEPGYDRVFGAGSYRSYNRLLSIKREKDGSFSTKPIADLPASLWGYNFEGLAQDEKGFFAINDKFTPVNGQNRSYLVYLSY